MNYQLYFAANTYNVDAYGSGTYQGEVTGASTSGTSTSGTSGLLANTGYDIIIPVSLGLAVLGASAIMLIKKLLSKKS